MLQELQDTKLANHGKQVSGDKRSQIATVNQQPQQPQQQGAADHLGPKSVSTGSHGVKTNQISPGNPGLKGVSQAVSSIGGMLKTKTKRERSISIDSGQSVPPALETDAKGGKTYAQSLSCTDCLFLFYWYKSSLPLSSYQLNLYPKHQIKCIHLLQQEVHVGSERTKELVFSRAEMSRPFQRSVRIST